MKKWILVFFCLLLTGCGSAPTFETLGDVPHQQAVAPIPRSVLLELPADAVKAAWTGAEDTLYLCEDYTVHLQTLSAGDLGGTIRRLSGFEKENLTVIESRCGDHKRYEWVWTAAAEGGDAVYRCAVLDDGNFHYALTLSAGATDAGGLTEAWNQMISTFCLEQTPDTPG